MGETKTVKLDRLPPDLRAQLLAKQAAEPGRVEPGLHASADGSAFVYGGLDSAAPPDQQRRPSPYTARIARDLAGGIEVTAAGSAYPVKLVPLSWNNGSGRIVDDRVEYAVGGAARAVYSFKRNGVKEDIVLEHPSSDALSLQFRLEMDSMLEARLDGKGNLLVYGPEAVLGGFIQTGDDESAQLVLKARQRAPKDRILYVIPAPVVVDGAGMARPGLANYSIAGTTLTLRAAGLCGLAAPVTIDPSIVVTTTADFRSGNDEGMISFDTDAISRASTHNSDLDEWTNTTVLTSARMGHTSVVYRGYLYVLGGWTGSACLDNVEFAPINPDGTLGSWTATTSLTAPRYQHATVVYNGYLYVLGGSIGSVAISDVQYAPINADGTVGVWTYTTFLTDPRNSHTAVASNGYVYILGGSHGSSYLSDVEYAPLKADGTLGAWATTTSFATGRRDHSTIAHNGHLYVLGGYSGTTVLGDVQYATINANGTIGAWAATTSFPNARRRHASVVWNGYLYVMSGQTDTGYTQDAECAPINANGTIGQWRLTYGNSLCGYSYSGVAYNGYIYNLGGVYGINGDFSNYVRVAPVIEKTYYPGVYTTPFLGLGGRSLHQSVAYRGFLYVIGGENYTGELGDVLVAPLNSDGTVGSWSVTTGFATARRNHTSVAYNGYLYVIGGYNSSCLSDVQYAPINANGSVGPWSGTTGLPQGIYGHSSVAYNGYVYVIGGHNCLSTVNLVQVAQLNLNGTVGTWSGTAGFPTARAIHASVAHNGYLYVIGGWNGTYQNDVQFTPIHANGSVGSWGATTSLPTPLAWHTSFVHDGRLFVLGGERDWGAENSGLIDAPLHLDGSIGAWTDHGFGFVPYGIAQQASTTYNGYLYATGGDIYDPDTNYHDYLDSVRVISLNTSGTVGSWNSTTGFTTPRQGHAVVAKKGFMYILGGTNGSPLNDVRYAPVNANGSVGAWSSASSFLTPRSGHASVAHNGFVYILGGYDGGTALNDVQFAPVNADGTLGAWSLTTGLSTARSGHSAVAYAGHLYVLGGNGGSYLNDVLVAPINADGTVGAWTETTSFNVPRDSHTSVAYDGYLYVMGGTNGATLRDVQFAPIGSGGSVGAWAGTAGFDTPRRWHTSVATNGYVYVIGGMSGTAFLNDVQYAPINSDGTLGAWYPSLSFTTPRSGHASVAYNGFLYLVGGYGGSYLNDVRVATLIGPTARGRYSRLIDIGSDRIIDSLSFLNSGSKGSTNLTYAVAPSATAVFGTRMTITDAAGGTLYTAGLGTCGRWVWASFDMDDTQSATIDGGGLQGRTDLLELDVTYTVITPPVINAAATAPNEITVTWDAVSGAECYSVYRRRGSCSDYSYTLIASCVAGTFHVDTTVSGGSTYSYKVRTRMPGGCTSDYSICAEATATGDCSLLPIFGGLINAQYDGESPTCRIHLFWNEATSRCAGGPGISYHIYRSTDQAFVPATGNRIAQCVTATTYDDADVTQGTTYYYIVRAEDTTTAGGGPCNGGNIDANTTRRNAKVGVSVLFYDGFENGMDNWVGLYRYWIATDDVAHTGTYSAWSDETARTCSNLRHTSIAIPVGAQNPRLRFWTRYLLNTSNGEAGIVQGSANGTTWTKLTVIPAYPGTSDSSTDACLGTNPQPAFTGASTTWTEYAVDLSAYAGGNFSFKFNVVTTFDIFVGDWYIDDVSVTYEVPCTVAAHPGQIQNTLILSTFQGDVNLDWTAPAGDCSVSGYGVYRGSLPMTGYDHASLDCAVGGTSYTDVNPTEDYYYLVVPLNSTSEGLYGEDSIGAPRPQGTGPCKTQDVTPCN